jgi:anaerobic selenocysteine-containing dehydrogenase
MGAEADTKVIDDLLLGAMLGKAVAKGGPHEGRDPADLAAMLEAPTPPDRIVEALTRLGAYGDQFGLVPDGLTFADLRDAEHGIDLGALEPRVPAAITTPSGSIELTPPEIVADVDRLTATLSDRDVWSGDPADFMLIGRRHVRSNNSWMHNVKVLVKGKDRCTLLIHPEDAARAGVSDGGVARISSEAGSIEAPVEVSDEMMRGVVCLPHGWGHDKVGARLSVAREHAGVNNNLLAPGTLVDEISGNAIVNGIPVEVVPA